MLTILLWLSAVEGYVPYGESFVYELYSHCMELQDENISIAGGRENEENSI